MGKESRRNGAQQVEAGGGQGAFGALGEEKHFLVPKLLLGNEGKIVYSTILLTSSAICLVDYSRKFHSNVRREADWLIMKHYFNSMNSIFIIT